jgi:MoaA/NifB/PqqE/SkfB family radical SAM enzyme
MSITERIDAITAIDPEHQGTVIPPPKSVKIELTARCDFRCFFCASAKRLREKRDMDLKTYRRIITELRDAGVEELGVFYLGESFVLRDLAEYIRVAKDVGFPYVFLTTNGLKATPQRVQECMEAGLDSLKFSLNWADEEQFEEVTGMPGKLYPEVVNNIKSAQAARAAANSKCGIYCSSIMYDGEQQEKMEAIVGEIAPYVDEHYWLPLYNQGALTTDVAMDRGYTPSAGNMGRIGALRKPVPCWSAFTEGHITWDGHLSACCFDHSHAWQMGDLKEVSFMDAWNSAPFQKLRQAHLDEDLSGTPCEQCVAWT